MPKIPTMTATRAIKEKLTRTQAQKLPPETPVLICEQYASLSNDSWWKASGPESSDYYFCKLENATEVPVATALKHAIARNESIYYCIFSNAQEHGKAERDMPLHGVGGLPSNRGVLLKSKPEGPYLDGNLGDVSDRNQAPLFQVSVLYDCILTGKLKEDFLVELLVPSDAYSGGPERDGEEDMQYKDVIKCKDAKVKFLIRLINPVHSNSGYVYYKEGVGYTRRSEASALTAKKIKYMGLSPDQFLYEKLKPVKLCSINQLFSGTKLALVKAAPTNETVRGLILAATGQMPPDNLDSYEALAEWLEWNCEPRSGTAPTSIKLPETPLPRPTFALSFQLKRTVQGHCRYTVNQLMTHHAHLTVANVEESIRRTGSNDPAVVMAELARGVREIASLNYMRDYDAPQYSHHEADPPGEPECVPLADTVIRRQFAAFIQSHPQLRDALNTDTQTNQEDEENI